MKYYNYSGGADGADSVFENDGEKYGVETIAFSFYGHKTKSKNRVELGKDELDESWEHILIANKTLKRNINYLSLYVKRLLARDWFQVKNSDAIFAVAHMIDYKVVKGGTGWACQLGLDNKKPVYVYDSNFKSWFFYDYDKELFVKYEGIPKLTEKFAGIGSREIDEFGIKAIENLYKYNFDV